MTDDTTRATSEGDVLPPTESVWLDTTPETAYDPLPGDTDVDVCVVGGGIVGVTAAAELVDAGERVAIVERDRIVEGVTGNTTAKLTAQHGLVYADLADTLGDELARRYAEANQQAIADVAERVDRLDVVCDFARTPAYTYTQTPEKRDAIEAEVEAARRFGLPAHHVEGDETPLPFDVEAAVRVDEQARFHPRAYLLALAEHVVDTGGRVFEHTRATDVAPGGRPRVVTDRGTVRADAVVVATHFPVRDRRFLFARLTPHRSYALVVEASDAPTEGMYYRVGGNATRSLRTGVTDRENSLIVGGEGHRTGQGDPEASYRRLAHYARDRFDVEAVPYRWSTQDLSTPDGVPFVGRAGPVTDEVYIATGFGGWGMSNGTAAGRLLADLVLDRPNPYRELYDPRRLSLSALRTLLSHNAETTREFVGGWAAGVTGSGPTPAPGEGRVVRRGATPVAVSRDRGGELHAVSAVCTHMDCVVDWNPAEESWDCPCHGSRFAPDGRVLDGPAVEDLPRRPDEE
ncbi:FAD-dependent oxidoreductase [Halomarina ordinaria]|uniref:FAD-dependent oxidoreductase n=1 Tax=Halomarina ordinaria TaxID=3033939 RepID=A0ABD5UH45_9EURY|nr:FAD-dependent oxidoreductase [Halomarina sp. PSRA2]